MQRYALVHGTAAQVAPYLPGNYDVLAEGESDGYIDLPNGGCFPPGAYTVIGGRDNAGWTLDAYVIPRLASGLYATHEIDLSHPIMATVPEPRA